MTREDILARGYTEDDLSALEAKGVKLDDIADIIGDTVIINDIPLTMDAIRRSGGYRDGKWFSPGGIEQFRPKTGGMLNRGGTPGHPGGRNQPKAVREKLRRMFVKNLDKLQEVIDDPNASKKDKMKAMDMMASYGLGRASAVLDDQGNAIQGLVIKEVAE